MQLRICFDDAYTELFEAEKADCTQIPCEYYKVERYWFSDSPVKQQLMPYNIMLVDSSSSYFNSSSNQYMANLLKKYIGTEDLVKLQSSLRHLREKFEGEEKIEEVNAKLSTEIERLRVSIDVTSNIIFSIILTFPPTEMCTCTTCLARRNAYSFPQGIFLVKIKDVQDYVNIYNPLSLVWNRATKIEVQTEKLLNWGESKGLQADSTLIYLTDKLIEAYKSKGKINIPEATKRKFYVAVTRAKFTVGLVVPNDFDNTHIKLPFWRIE